MSIKIINVLVLNGPNLNLLGQREPNLYGKQTLQDIITGLENEANSSNINLTHLQSNREYELIEKIHDAFANIDFIIINPGAFTHTSIALRDALLGGQHPFYRSTLIQHTCTGKISSALLFIRYSTRCDLWFRCTRLFFCIAIGAPTLYRAIKTKCSTSLYLRLERRL